MMARWGADHLDMQGLQWGHVLYDRHIFTNFSRNLAILLNRIVQSW